MRSIFQLSTHTCYSQEAPTLGKKFEDVSYRTNVCYVQQMILDGEIEFRDSLRGLNLSVYMPSYPNNTLGLFEISEQGTIPEEDPGMFPSLLDELAKRAGFQWRNTFSVGNDLNEEEDGDKTYTDLLVWSTQNYDISADYWNESSERRAKGINFLYPWYDDSLLLVSDSRKTRVFVMFMEPFQTRVWLAIGFAIVMTGILYSCLEKWEKRSDQRRPNASSSIFLAALNFTGHFKFQVRLQKHSNLSCYSSS